MSIEPERRPDSEKPRRDVYVDEKDFQAILDPVAREAAIEAETKRQRAAPDQPRVWRRRGDVLLGPWIKRKPGFVLDVEKVGFKFKRLEGGVILLVAPPSAWQQKEES